MWRIIKIAALWSLALRAIYVLCGIAVILWTQGSAGFPSYRGYGRFVGEQIGAIFPAIVLAAIVGACFYYPKRNQWWEKRGILPAIITVIIVHGLALIGELSRHAP